jgi:hypothetical protein
VGARKHALAPLKKRGTSIAPFLRGLGDLFCVSPNYFKKEKLALSGRGSRNS